MLVNEDDFYDTNDMKNFEVWKFIDDRECDISYCLKSSSSIHAIIVQECVLFHSYRKWRYYWYYWVVKIIVPVHGWKYMRSGGTVPCVLKFGARQVIDQLCTVAASSLGKTSEYPLNGKLVGSHRWSELLRIKSWFVCHPACCIITKPNELAQLHYWIVRVKEAQGVFYQRILA
jgi:hypothetical protein